MDISVHDNYLVSYCVFAEQAEIRLHTLYRDCEPQVHTCITFTGVMGYHFENDNFGTILFDIAETDLERLCTENQELFEQGRNYGWPGPWNSSTEAAIAYLREQGVSAFEVSSSCGMWGWVLAKTMTKTNLSAV